MRFLSSRTQQSLLSAVHGNLILCTCFYVRDTGALHCVAWRKLKMVLPAVFQGDLMLGCAFQFLESHYRSGDSLFMNPRFRTSMELGMTRHMVVYYKGCVSKNESEFSCKGYEMHGKNVDPVLLTAVGSI